MSDAVRRSTTHVHQVRDEVRGVLKDHGLRATASRLAVLVVLHEHRGPMTHEQVMDDLPPGAYDKASIWRILADLAEIGLLSRMDLGDRIWRYELRDACRSVTDDHAHFLCEGCGDVRCLPPIEIRARDGRLPDVLHGAEFRVRVTGTCAECASA